jgi:hypothetical protein
MNTALQGGARLLPNRLNRFNVFLLVQKPLKRLSIASCLRIKAGVKYPGQLRPRGDEGKGLNARNTHHAVSALSL